MSDDNSTFQKDPAQSAFPGMARPWPAQQTNDPSLFQLQQMQNSLANQRLDALKYSTPVAYYQPKPPMTKFQRKLVFAFLSPYFLTVAGLLWLLQHIARFGGVVERLYSAAVERSEK